MSEKRRGEVGGHGEQRGQEGRGERKEIKTVILICFTGYKLAEATKNIWSNVEAMVGK